MFRRSASLPARPSIPNKDEILQDLNNAGSDDVMYDFKEEIAANENKHKKKTNEEYDLEDVQFENNTSASYLKIDSFLDKIGHLKNYLVNLEEQKTNLKNLEENLLQDMDRIKKELNSRSESL